MFAFKFLLNRRLSVGTAGTAGRPEKASLHKHAASRLKSGMACWVMAAMLAGCSSTNPYQRSLQVDLPIKQLAKQAEESGAEPLAGQLHGAVMALKDQRREWYESLSAQSRVRALTQMSLVGLTAITLYSGLKSGVASDGDKKRLALAGALGFGAYGVGTWFVSPEQEKAYVQGVESLTCSLLTIEPLSLGTASFTLMAAEQKTLTQKINELDQSLLAAESGFRYAKAEKSPQAMVRAEAGRALLRARKTLASSEQLYREFGNSGITLMREGDLVFAGIAKSINSANKSVDEPGTLLTKGAATIGAFRSVKIDVASEAQGPVTEEKEAAVNGDTEKTNDTTSTSAVGIPKTVDGKLLETASDKDVAAELESRRQRELKTLSAALGKARLEAAGARKEAARLKDMTVRGTIKDLVAACRAAQRTDCEIGLEADATALALATQTAALYAARRPLSNRLLTFNDARKAAEKNRSCTGAGSPMSVNPSADANIAPGASYPIVISGVTVPPSVSLRGDASFAYFVGPGGNQYTYKVIADAKAKGDIHVSISDRGLVVEEINLTVVDAKKP